MIHRAKLVALRSGLKAQVHAVLAKQGVHIEVSDLFGVTGRRLLSTSPLEEEYRMRVDSLPRLVEVYDTEVDQFDQLVRRRLAAGWRSIQTIVGYGRRLPNRSRKPGEKRSQHQPSGG